MSGVIALAGQPNTGKSTVFNCLTGSRQHVGNWPGKTVEQKSGKYAYLNSEFTVMDLPGTYSLSANSPEEVITRDYLVSGKADVLVVMIDASQFERSLYFLSEIVGLSIPTVIALNMVDVAKEKGITINIKELKKRLGVPIIEMVASKKVGLEELKGALVEAKNKNLSIKVDNLFKIFNNRHKGELNIIADNLSDVQYGNYSKEWLAIKMVEEDELVMNVAKKQLKIGDYRKIYCKAKEYNLNRMESANLRFNWIGELTNGIVKYSHLQGETVKRSLFDRLSTHKIWGQPLAILMIIMGFILSMIISMPFMVAVMSYLVPSFSTGAITLLQNTGVPYWVVSFAGEAIIPAAFMALFMVLFVSIVIFVFGVMEDVGYLARVAFVFDRSMRKLGLHGKAIIPFMMSLGCNIAGITGARVIDSLKQRRLAIVVSLVVPCAGMWGVISFVSVLFFGSYTPIIILGLLALSIVHMKFTSWFFGTKVIGVEQSAGGLVMELPPFHKPNWNTIFANAWYNIKNVAKKAFVLIVAVSAVIWLLSYTDGGNVENSIIYAIGKFVEPVSKVFGFDWRLFIAFIVSAMGKEAALGVIAMLFGQGGGIVSFTGTMVSGSLQYSNVGLQTAMLSGVSTASALAFIVAFYFNVPCMAAIASTRIESRSKSFMFKSVAYYMISALILGGIVYRIALLFM